MVGRSRRAWRTVVRRGGDGLREVSKRAIAVLMV